MRMHVIEQGLAHQVRTGPRTPHAMALPAYMRSYIHAYSSQWLAVQQVYFRVNGHFQISQQWGKPFGQF